MDTNTTTSKHNKKKNYEHKPPMKDAARWSIPPEEMKKKLKEAKDA